MILSNIWKTKAYKDVSWSLLISLDETMKEKDELRNSNSQRKLCTMIQELLDLP